jgi:ACS family tartrate transporter-like MFS transporter
VPAVPLSPLYRKIAWRLVPFLMLLYLVAFLDRVNISFAALTMNRDLGISETLYGFAAGVFFLSYCLFQVPANMMLARLGARRWLAILMVSWGIVSMATAFVANPPTYIGARFLLGIAESGFYPGVIYYFTFWLPRSVRTRMLALFLLALPLCNSIGSPISAHILLMHPVAGLKNWQWLFLIEGAPALILGAASWFLLADNPWTASWLSQPEKDQLAREMKIDNQPQGQGTGKRWLPVTLDSAAYFLWSTGIYGLSFFLPKILVAAGASTLATGWWGTLTFAAGAAALLWASRQGGFRALPYLFLLGAAGFFVVGFARDVPVSVAGFCFAAMGLLSSLPMFWSMAASRLSGKAAGTAIAIVNSFGAVGAFAGPYAMGWLHDLTHSYSAGLWAIASCMALGGLLVFIGGTPRPSESALAAGATA